MLRDHPQERHHGASVHTLTARCRLLGAGASPTPSPPPVRQRCVGDPTAKIPLAGNRHCRARQRQGVARRVRTLKRNGWLYEVEVVGGSKSLTSRSTPTKAPSSRRQDRPDRRRPRRSGRKTRTRPPPLGTRGAVGSCRDRSRHDLGATLGAWRSLRLFTQWSGADDQSLTMACSIRCYLTDASFRFVRPLATIPAREPYCHNTVIAFLEFAAHIVNTLKVTRIGPRLAIWPQR